MKRYLLVFDNNDREDPVSGVEVIDQEQYDKLMDKDTDSKNIMVWTLPDIPSESINTKEEYKNYISVNEITDEEYNLLKRLNVHSAGNTMLQDVFNSLDDEELNEDDEDWDDDDEEIDSDD